MYNIVKPSKVLKPNAESTLTYCKLNNWTGFFSSPPVIFINIIVFIIITIIIICNTILLLISFFISS